MDISESLSLLQEMFKNKDWYYDVDTDSLGRLVVYCNYMNTEVFSATPSKIGDRYVLINFASYKKIEAKPNKTTLEELIALEENATVGAGTSKLHRTVNFESPAEPDVPYLIRELDRLERICGSSSLQDVFYEVHDGKNAVTNVSSRYPEVREGLEYLYQAYGFDVIYEELDG